MTSRKPFHPSDYDLSDDFRLTRVSDLKGWGCKVPRDVLHRLLEGLDSTNKNGSNDGQNLTSHSALTPESKSTPVVGTFIESLKWISEFTLNCPRNWSWFLCTSVTSWGTFFSTINRFLLSTCRWSIRDGKDWSIYTMERYISIVRGKLLVQMF